MDEQLRVIKTPAYAAVMLDKTPLGAVAEASFLGVYPELTGSGPSVWYLNRVLVQDKSLRGGGFGSQLLNRLLSILSELKCSSLIVTPGGYGGDWKQQDRFYLRNGFQYVQTTQTGSLLIWKPAHSLGE